MAEAKKSAASSKNNASADQSTPTEVPKAVVISKRSVMKDPGLAEGQSTDEASTGTTINVRRDTDASAAAPSASKQRLTTPEPAESEPAPESVAETSAAGKPTVVAGGEKVIVPPTDTASNSATDAEATSEPDTKSEAPKTDDTSNDNAQDTTAAASEKESGEDKPKTPSGEEIDAAEAAKQIEHDAAIQKLVDSKQYFLSINAVEKRKTKNFVVLGILLSVILVAAWADVALDAGIIHVSGVKPLTHFFSN